MKHLGKILLAIGLAAMIYGVATIALDTDGSRAKASDEQRHSQEVGDRARAYLGGDK